MYREYLICADILARLSLEQEEIRVVLQNPPRSVIRCLYDDCVGVSHPRIILTD